jgi:hypothetical protein
LPDELLPDFLFAEQFKGLQCRAGTQPRFSHQWPRIGAESALQNLLRLNYVVCILCGR